MSTMSNNNCQALSILSYFNSILISSYNKKISNFKLANNKIFFS